MNISRQTFLVKQFAEELGFDFCGISKADFLEAEAPLLEQWLSKGFHGKMHYMENHFDKRLDPRLLVDGAKSVISLLLNYYPRQSQTEAAARISKYAYGTDYHIVIKEKLKKLLDFIRQNIGDVNGRAFVDSAPVLDKAWAKRSGLGWVGKHSNLINKNSGSFFFIAELIVDIDFDYDAPIEDFCGTCTKCIDACPTDAIVQPYVVDGSRCISYLTIELKEKIPSEFSGKMDDWVFGCDVCQDVCPWNRFSKPHQELMFDAKNEILEYSPDQWREITEDVFKMAFADSPFMRKGFKGIQSTLDFIRQKKSPDE